MTDLWARRKQLARGLVLSARLLAAHPLRSALSLSGLLIGVAAVMVMVAIGRGAEQRVIQRLQGMGTDLLIVSAAPASSVAGRPRQVPVQTFLHADDAPAIVRASAAALAAAPAVNRSVLVRWDGRNATTMLMGTTTTGLRIRNVRAAAGRLFDDLDDRDRQRVAVLGPTFARSLFGGIDPVGRIMAIGNVPFEVIGVAQPRGTDPVGADLDDIVIVPFGTAVRRVLNVPYVHALVVQARSSAHLDELDRDVREILQQRLAARSGTLDPFVIQNQAVLLRTERGAAEAMNRLVVGVAALALVLGAVGILSVMLISVRERTREIGLRRALGAKRADIHIQFIAESAMLAAGGGVTGVLVGFTASAVAAAFGLWDLVISWEPAAIGLACSVVLGLLVGVIPAARAARFEPSDALRA